MYIFKHRFYTILVNTVFRKESLHFASVVDDAKCIVVTRVCVCVCLSAAACPHYCTGPDVTWGSGRGCHLVVHYWADLQSVHGLRCYGNITRTRNVSEYMIVLALCLVDKRNQLSKDVVSCTTVNKTGWLALFTRRVVHKSAKDYQILLNSVKRFESDLITFRVSQTVSVCLSAAACLHYCTDPDVTWGVVGYAP